MQYFCGIQQRNNTHRITVTSKLLYVAATRALHELTVLYQNSLTDIIGTEVPKEKHMQEFQTESLQKSERIRKTGTHTERDRTAAKRRG